MYGNKNVLAVICGIRWGQNIFAPNFKIFNSNFAHPKLSCCHILLIMSKNTMYFAATT